MIVEKIASRFHRHTGTSVFLEQLGFVKIQNIQQHFFIMFNVYYFCNSNLTELQMINLESMKFDQRTLKPDRFFVELQTTVKQSLPYLALSQSLQQLKVGRLNQSELQEKPKQTTNDKILHFKKKKRFSDF